MHLQRPSWPCWWLQKQTALVSVVESSQAYRTVQGLVRQREERERERDNVWKTVAKKFGSFFVEDSRNQRLRLWAEIEIERMSREKLVKGKNSFGQ